jgi:hypothetical protein
MPISAGALAFAVDHPPERLRRGEDIATPRSGVRFRRLSSSEQHEHNLSPEITIYLFFTGASLFQLPHDPGRAAAGGCSI